MSTLDPRTSLRAGVLCVCLLSAACAAPGSSDLTPDEFYDGETSIDVVGVSCSADNDEWIIQVDTFGWTAGGAMVWTADGLYLEEHNLVSDEADFSGAWDLLLLELSVAADPRDQSKNSSTSLLCDPPTRDSLRGWLVIYDPETEEAVDCRTWGAAFDWENAGYPPCDVSEAIELR